METAIKIPQNVRVSTAPALAIADVLSCASSQAFLMDCMQGMRLYPDNYFDWAVVDPPYFDAPNKLGYYGARKSSTGVYREDFKKIGTWDVPGYEYYNELVRVSKHQIIWGINYFEFAGEVAGRIIWDKCNDTSSFSKCEIASCSKIWSVHQFRFLWNGMMQGKSMNNGTVQQGNKKLNEKRIHPTQKPIALYDWIFSNYAEKGQRVLDTHLGSGSSRISAHKAGLHFTGFEMEEEYFEAHDRRWREYSSQLRLL